MIRIVAGTYEGLLYGWEMPTSGDSGAAKMKLTFGYSAHSECIKSVALMAAKQGKTLLSGSADEMIKCVWHDAAAAGTLFNVLTVRWTEQDLQREQAR